MKPFLPVLRLPPLPRRPRWPPGEAGELAGPFTKLAMSISFQILTLWNVGATGARLTEKDGPTLGFGARDAKLPAC